MQAKSNQNSVPSTTPLPAVTVSNAAKEHAQRHYERAQAQIKLKKLSLALQELRDAIKLDPGNSEYHALMGKVHLDRGMTGMATISLRQALKLNPDESLALECMQELATQARDRKANSASMTSRFLNFLNRKL